MSRIYRAGLMLWMPVTVLFAASHKIAPELRNAAGNVDVIIQFDDRPGNADAAQISAKGGVLKKQFRNVPITSARLPVASLEGLAQNPR